MQSLEPNFGDYTRDQLLDAQAHIDRDRFPKRAAELDRLVADQPAKVGTQRAEPYSAVLKWDYSSPVLRALLCPRTTADGIDIALNVLLLTGLACFFADKGRIGALPFLACGIPMLLLGLRGFYRRGTSSELPFWATGSGRALVGGVLFTSFGLLLLILAAARLVSSLRH